jgi:hypothetical protein
MHPLQNAGGHILQRLSLPHDVQVVLHAQPENGENLIEHFPVLRRHTHVSDKAVPPLPERLDNGGELDGFWTGPENDKDFVTE